MRPDGRIARQFRAQIVDLDRQRVDHVTDGGYADRVVVNAPLSEDNFFMVPKVVE